MKALRAALRTLPVLSSSSSIPTKTHVNSSLLCRFYAAEPQQDDESGDSTFDSTEYTLPNTGFDEINSNSTWKKKYRDKADRVVFGEETKNGKLFKEEEKRQRANVLAKALLKAALERADEEEEEEDDLVVKEEDQKSLSVGIIGAPNAGKSALTNYMVGTKVAAVSRKTHTTTHEVLGVVTKGNTQICFFDTPGITQRRIGFPYKDDINVRVESAWSSVDLYDVLIVIFDVHRHLNRPDERVIRLIKCMGSLMNLKQKRLLCMNKVDLVEKKKDLLKVAEQFKDLPGYDKYFMISGLKGSGVKDLTKYLMEQVLMQESWRVNYEFENFCTFCSSIIVTKGTPFWCEHQFLRQLKDLGMKIPIQ